jgi:hypothetical protein
VFVTRALARTPEADESAFRQCKLTVQGPSRRPSRSQAWLRTPELPIEEKIFDHGKHGITRKRGQLTYTSKSNAIIKVDLGIYRWVGSRLLETVYQELWNCFRVIPCFPWTKCISSRGRPDRRRQTGVPSFLPSDGPVISFPMFDPCYQCDPWFRADIPATSSTMDGSRRKT